MDIVKPLKMLCLRVFEPPTCAPYPMLLKLDLIRGYFCISNHNLILSSYGETHHSSWTKRTSFGTQMRSSTTKRRSLLALMAQAYFVVKIQNRATVKLRTSKYSSYLIDYIAAKTSSIISLFDLITAN